MKVTKAQLIERFQKESVNLSADDKRNLIREILQEAILCHMHEVNLFDEMAFHGGTSLRLLHRIDRFSEDLDMSLIKLNKNYDLPAKMEPLKKSLISAGIDLEFQNKCKPHLEIKKFFLNDISLLNLFRDEIGNVIDGEKIKIKFELDISPPDHQEFEMIEIKSLFSAKIKAHNLATCMGQKIHAVLCRGHAYGMDIVKGRDLYDLEWYLANTITPNLNNLSGCLYRLGPWEKQNLNVDITWVKAEISKCLETKDFAAILADVKPLVNSAEYDRISKLWGQSYFSSLSKKLV